MMETLFSSPIFSFVVLFLIAAYIGTIIVSAVLYAAKKSELAGRILGVLVGLMFLYTLISQVSSLAGGALLDLRVLSNLLISVAFLFASAGFMFKQVNTIFSIIFFLLLGPGLILMAWTWDLPGIGVGVMHVLSVIFALLWLSLLATLAYGYLKRPKKT